MRSPPGLSRWLIVIRMSYSLANQAKWAEGCNRPFLATQSTTIWPSWAYVNGQRSKLFEGIRKREYGWAEKDFEKATPHNEVYAEADKASGSWSGDSWWFVLFFETSFTILLIINFDRFLSWFFWFPTWKESTLMNFAVTGSRKSYPQSPSPQPNTLRL